MRIQIKFNKLSDILRENKREVVSGIAGLVILATLACTSAQVQSTQNTTANKTAVTSNSTSSAKLPIVKPVPTTNATATPTPMLRPPYPSIQSYLDSTSSELSQIILNSFLKDNSISPMEIKLIRNLVTYAPDDQKDIVGAGLVDEEFPARDANIVMSRLVSPSDVVFYLNNFFTYFLQSPVTYKPASISIQEGKGSSVNYAQIAAEILRNHGYQAWNMGIDITSDKGHNVGAWNNNDGFVSVITNGSGRGDLQGAVLLGPYPSYKLAGTDIENKGYAPLGMGDFRLLYPNAIQNPRTDISNFPWQIVSNQ